MSIFPAPISSVVGYFTRPKPRAPTSIRLTSAFDYDIKDPRDLDYSSLPPDEVMELRGRRDDAQMASRLYWGMVDAAGPQGPQDPQSDEDLAGSILYGSATAVLSDPKAAPEAKRQAQETLRLHQQRVSEKRAVAEKGLAETHQAPADVYARILAMRKTGQTDLEIDRTLEAGGWDVRKIGAQRFRKFDEYARIMEESGDFSGAKRLRLAKLDIIRNGGGAVEFGPEDLRLAQIRLAERMPQTVPEAFSSAVLDGANQTVSAIQRYAGARPDDTDGALAKILGVLNTPIGELGNPDAVREQIEAQGRASRDVIAAQGRGAARSAPATALAGNLAGGFVDPVLGVFNFVPFSLPARALSKARYLQTLIGRGVAPQIAAAAAEKLTMEGVAREAAKQWFIKKGITNQARAEVFGGILVNAAQNAAFGAGIGAFQAGSYEGATTGDVLAGGLFGGAKGAAVGVAFEGAFRGLRAASEIMGGTIDGQAQAMLDLLVADPALATLAPKLGEFSVMAREASRLKGSRLDAAEAEGIAQGLGFSLAEPEIKGGLDAGRETGPLAGGAGEGGAGAGESGRVDRAADGGDPAEPVAGEAAGADAGVQAGAGVGEVSSEAVNTEQVGGKTEGATSDDIRPAAAPDAEARAAQQAEGARADEAAAAGEGAAAGVLVADRAADEGGAAGKPGEAGLGVKKGRGGVKSAGGDKDLGAGEHGGKDSVQTVRDFDQLLKVVADSPPQVRTSDVPRLLDQVRDEELGTFRRWVSGQPDFRTPIKNALKKGVDERIKGLSPEARAKAIAHSDQTGTVSPKLAADDPRRPGESQEDFDLRVKHRGAEEDTGALGFNEKEVSGGESARADEVGGAGRAGRGAGKQEDPAGWDSSPNGGDERRLADLIRARFRGSNKRELGKQNTYISAVKANVGRIRVRVPDAARLLAADRTLDLTAERGRALMADIAISDDAPDTLGYHDVFNFFTNKEKEVLDRLAHHFGGDRLLPDIETIDLNVKADRDRLLAASEAHKGDLAPVAADAVARAIEHGGKVEMTAESLHAAGGSGFIPADTRIFMLGEDTPAKRAALAKVVNRMAKTGSDWNPTARAVPGVKSAEQTRSREPPVAPGWKAPAEALKWLEQKTHTLRDDAHQVQVQPDGALFITSGQIAFIVRNPKTMPEVLLGLKPGNYRLVKAGSGGVSLGAFSRPEGLKVHDYGVALSPDFPDSGKASAEFGYLTSMVRAARGAGADDLVLTRRADKPNQPVGMVALDMENTSSVEFGQVEGGEPYAHLSTDLLADALEWFARANTRTEGGSAGIRERVMRGATVELSITPRVKGLESQMFRLKMPGYDGEVIVAARTSSHSASALPETPAHAPPKPQAPSRKSSSGGGGKSSALRPPPAESLEGPPASRKPQAASPPASRTPPKVPPEGAEFPGPKMVQPNGPDSIPLPPGANDPTGWRPDITPRAGPADGAFEGRQPAIRPTPFPEMVALAEAFMGSRPFLAALRGSKGGDFSPMGPGRIRLSVKDASNPVALARTLAHEIGHLIDYLPDQTMKRGNLLGRVLSTTQKWTRNEASAIIKKLEPIVSDGKTLSGETPVVGPSIAEATNKELREELLELTRWWHPYDPASVPYDPASVPAAYKAYRASGKELFAEGLSVFLNSPGDLKQRAPKFYNELVIHLNRKPEVLDGIMAVQSMLNGEPAALAVARQARAEIGTLKAEDRLREAEVARQTDSQSFVSYLGTLLMDAQGPVLDKTRQALRDGVPLDMEEGAFMAMDDWRYQDNPLKITMDRVKAEFDQPLIDAGILRGDADAYMTAYRIAEGDRSEMANPGGITQADARFGLDELRKRLGDEKYAALEKSVGKLRSIAFDLNEQALAAGVISQKNFDEKVVPNKDTYAPFWVLDYVHRGMSAGIKSQVGTLKDIASPVTAMLHKMVAVHRATEANKAKKAVLVDLIDKHFPGEVKWHEPTFGEEGRVTSPPPVADPGKELVHMYRDGRIVHAEVEPYLARVFMDRDIGQLTRLARVSGLTTSRVFHPLYVTYNQGFALRNVVRDFFELYRNTAALTGQVVDKGLPTERTIKGSNPLAEAMGFATIFGFKPRYLLNRAPTFLEVLTETARAVPESVRKATGWGKTETLDAMLKERGIDTRYLYEAYRSSDIELESADRILARSGIRRDDLVEAVARWTGLLRMVHGTLNFLPAVSDNLSKVAAFHLLNDRGITGKRRAYFTRNYTGTPSLRKGGHAVQASNGLLMYSKAQIEGFARGARLAAGRDPIFPKSAAGWWTRMMLTGILPKVTMRAAAIGAFGALAKAWIDNIPDSDKMHGTVIPVPPFFMKNAKTGKMESRYLFIPHDYSTRFLMAPFWQALKGEPGRAVGQVVGELPGLATPFEIARSWEQYAATGNSYDAFRGRMVLNRDQEAAGGWDAVKGMGEWSWNQLGVLSSAGRLVQDPLTLLQNPADALFRRSDRGLDEEMYQQADLEDAERARFKLGLPDSVKQVNKERYKLHRFRATGELTTDMVKRLAVIDSWYRMTYKPQTDRIKRALEQKNAAEEAAARKQLAEESARISQK